MSDSTVGPNGKLKDASEIVWYNDVDDEQPIPSSSTIKSPLHPFFVGAAPPAAIIAGARHSTRVPQPSMRILDPDNVASSSTTQDIGGTDLDHPDAVDTEAEDDVEHAYALTKAMGDADCKGSTHRPKAEQTADVHTIFIKKDDYVDPHTGLVEPGHMCTVCQ
ncbi:hypothetical protein EDB19DRAFT_2025397 [Suillus lakei]|nr:hypothetical protein EDB19DRAFT_2025397 [Suillus lakei]